MITAIQAVRNELHRVQREQKNCIDDSGIVIPHFKHRYQELVKQAKYLKESLTFLQSM